MSALAVPARIVPAYRVKLTELDALREISREVANSAGPATVESIARIALRISGIYHIEINGAEWGQVPKRTSVGTASHGPVKITFDLEVAVLDSPLRFARFVAQQVLHLASIEDLKAQRRKLRDKIQLLSGILGRRKAIHRARAIIRGREGLTEAAALERLREYSRERGKKLHEIAEAIVISEGQVWKRPFPVLARRVSRSFGAPQLLARARSSR